MIKYKAIQLSLTTTSLSHILTSHMTASVSSYKRKKVQTVQNFFRHFHTEFLRTPAFFLPPKSGVFVSRLKP